MQAVTGREIHERLSAELAALDCTIETSSRGLWARRRTLRRRRVVGWQLCVYCLTLVLDETGETVHFWDAVMEKRRGILAPHRDPVAAAGALLVRSRIEQVIREAGWVLQYRLGHLPVAPPRVFRP